MCSLNSKLESRLIAIKELIKHDAQATVGRCREALEWLLGHCIASSGNDLQGHSINELKSMFKRSVLSDSASAPMILAQINFIQRMGNIANHTQPEGQSLDLTEAYLCVRALTTLLFTLYERQNEFDLKFELDPERRKLLKDMHEEVTSYS